METLEGGKFSLADAEKSHTAVVVLFISTICPYSNYYNDLMRDMASDFGKKGVAFVGINSGTPETVSEVRSHAREHGTPSRSSRIRRLASRISWVRAGRPRPDRRERSPDALEPRTEPVEGTFPLSALSFL